MAKDGIYSYVYSGDTGFGVGVFTIIGERISGGDWGELTYRGTVKKIEGKPLLRLDLTMHVPAGSPLAQGTSEQNVKTRREFATVVPASFTDGVPFQIFVPPVDVWIIARPVPDHVTWLSYLSSDPESFERLSTGIAALVRRISGGKEATTTMSKQHYEAGPRDTKSASEMSEKLDRLIHAVQTFRKQPTEEHQTGMLEYMLAVIESLGFEVLIDARHTDPDILLGLQHEWSKGSLK